MECGYCKKLSSNCTKSLKLAVISAGSLAVETAMSSITQETFYYKI